MLSTLCRGEKENGIWYLAVIDSLNSCRCRQILLILERF